MNVQVPDMSKFQPLDWHLDVLNDFDKRTKRYHLLNCHRRARKTTLAINVLVREAATHPRSVYGYIGPTYKQAKAIAWTDPNMMFNYLPEKLIVRKNESELLVELFNGSIITIKGGDDPDSLRGPDYRGVIVDEFSLYKSDIIWTEILQPIMAQSSERWALFPFTPKGRNHAYKYFHAASQQSQGWEDWSATTLTVENSGLIPIDELNKAKAKMPESLYRQEFFCEFIADDEFTLIRWNDLDALRKNIFMTEDKRRIIGMDPSEGGDECVLYAIEGCRIIDQMIIKGERDQNRIVGMSLMFGGRNKINSYAIDSIGIGSGICAGIEASGKEVFRINSAVKSTYPERFSNRRSEMWWYLWEQIKDFKIPYMEDEVLRAQLTAPKYEINRRGLIGMELKEKTKEYLGNSPDRADAFVYGIWALQFIKTESVKQDIQRFKHSSKKAYAGGAGGW